MATGFAAGLRSGGALVSQALENERLDEASRRQGEEFERKKVGWAREDATNKIVDENRQRLGGLATSGVIDDDQVRGLATRYGVTPEQVQAAQAQPGGAAALFKTYEDSATAAGTPLTGGLPAPEVKSRAATATDYEREAERGALRLGDVAGARTARAAGRTAGVQETVDASTKRWAAMKPEEREAAAWAQNTNRSDLPILTTEVGKNGMTIVGRDPRTGKADMKNPIKLSWADVSMMDAAQDLAAKGYGAEAIEMANKVDTRLGALVSEYNKQTVEMAKANNDATYKAGSLANDSARVGIARQTAANAEARARAGDYNPIGISPDGKSIQVWDTKMNRVASVPVQEGMDAKQQLQMMVQAQGRGGAGKTGSEKEAAAPGTIVERPDKTRFKDGGTDATTGRKIELGIKAVMPEERTQTLVKGGVPADIAEGLEWTTEGPAAGQHVVYNGRAYSATRPNDPGLEALRKQVMADRKTERRSDDIATQYRNDRAVYENPELGLARQQRTEEDIAASANPAFSY